MLCNAKCYITFEIKVISRGLIKQLTKFIKKDDTNVHSILEMKRNQCTYVYVNVYVNVCVSG